MRRRRRIADAPALSPRQRLADGGLGGIGAPRAAQMPVALALSLHLLLLPAHPVALGDDALRLIDMLADLLAGVLVGIPSRGWQRAHLALPQILFSVPPRRDREAAHDELLEGLRVSAPFEEERRRARAVRAVHRVDVEPQVGALGRAPLAAHLPEGAPQVRPVVAQGTQEEAAERRHARPVVPLALVLQQCSQVRLQRGRGVRGQCADVLIVWEVPDLFIQIDHHGLVDGQLLNHGQQARMYASDEGHRRGHILCEVAGQQRVEGVVPLERVEHRARRLRGAAHVREVRPQDEHAPLVQQRREQTHGAAHAHRLDKVREVDVHDRIVVAARAVDVHAERRWKPGPRSPAVCSLRNRAQLDLYCVARRGLDDVAQLRHEPVERAILRELLGGVRERRVARRRLGARELLAGGEHGPDCAVPGAPAQNAHHHREAVGSELRADRRRGHTPAEARRLLPARVREHERVEHAVRAAPRRLIHGARLREGERRGALEGVRARARPGLLTRRPRVRICGRAAQRRGGDGARGKYG